ncbi:MAG: alpha-ketoacid dehydrogenase subunit alpha/beta [Anaerolineales bacterium]
MELYRSLYRIRKFEETVLEAFPRGVFHGTTHTYLGQEANAAGVLAHLQPADVVFSNHRCHGHFLAYGGSPFALFAEMMGKPAGVCGGVGGSQHLHWRNFYSNGIQGGIVPAATGMAFAEQRKNSGAVVLCFIGDGTLGQGVLYESLNLAALWHVPIVYVLENNHIAQTTPTQTVLAGSMADRFRAFGIPVTELDSSDVAEIYAVSAPIFADVRTRKGPAALILHTHRLGPHSKGDDTRDPQVVAHLKATRDPVSIARASLAPETVTAIESEVNAEIAAAFEAALRSEPSAMSSEPSAVSSEPSAMSGEPSAMSGEPSAVSGEPSAVSASCLSRLNLGLRAALESDASVHLLGEDLLDPYGGAFKVTQGLSSDFPDRVHATPISEAAMVGAAAGMALRGLRPVVEIMFGDFITLAADQIINHAAKYHGMYNEQVRVPMVIRTPMGGRRGYGPTHSQSLEKHLLGTPGLRVIAPHPFNDPAPLLRDLILHTQAPVLFIENKLLYLLKLGGDTPDFELTPAEGSAITLRLRGAPAAQITLATYGYMAEIARLAALQLAYEDEIFCEIVIPTQLAPVYDAAILQSARRTGTLLTLEEGTHAWGWGAEILARAASQNGRVPRCGRIAAPQSVIPAALPLESAVLPGVAAVVEVVRGVANA